MSGCTLDSSFFGALLPQGVTIDNSGTKGFYISGEPVFVDTVSPL